MGVVLAVLALAPASAALTESQQKCVTTMNRVFAKLARGEAGEWLSCLKGWASQRNVEDVAACVALDRKGRRAKGALKATAKESGVCEGSDRSGAPRRPAVGVTSAANAAVAAAGEMQQLFGALLGPWVTASSAIRDQDKQHARCQWALLKSTTRCHKSKLATFNACKKQVLKAGAETAVDIEACFDADPKGTVAKQCDDPAKPDGIRRSMAKACAPAAVPDLAAALPGCAAPDAEALHGCMLEAIDCRLCLALDAADGLGRDCDLLDNGVADESCAPGVIAPVELTVSGQVLFDTAEAVEGARVSVFVGPGSAWRASETSQVADTTTGADGGFTADLGRMTLPLRMLVRVVHEPGDGPALRTSRWLTVDTAPLDVGTMVLPHPTLTELPVAPDGSAESADGSVRVDGLGPEIARLFAGVYDPDSVPEVFPGDFGEDALVRLDPAVFVWLEALAADGTAVDTLSQPASVRARVPPSQWGNLADIDRGTGQIDLPVFVYDETNDAWEQEGRGWLEDASGSVLPEEAEVLIVGGLYPGDVFLAFTATHFSGRSACVCHAGPWTLCRLPKDKRKNPCFQKAAEMAAKIARSCTGLGAYKKVHPSSPSDPLSDVAKDLAERKGPEIRAVKDLKDGKGKVVNDRWVPKGTPGRDMWARFDGDSGGPEDEFYMNDALWSQCTGSNAKSTTTKMLFAILHETAHWMDDVKKFPKIGSGAGFEDSTYDTLGEEGNQLEHDIFGGKILEDKSGTLRLDPDGTAPDRPITDGDMDGWLDPKNWPACGSGSSALAAQAVLVSSPLAVTISLPAGPFALGEEIPVEVTYENTSVDSVGVFDFVHLEGYPLRFDVVDQASGVRLPFLGGEAEPFVDEVEVPALAPGATRSVTVHLLWDPVTGVLRHALAHTGTFDVTAVYEEWGIVPETTSNTVSVDVSAGSGGGVAGTVTDEDSGLGVAGANVSFLLDGTPLARIAQTSGSGDYAMPELIPGTYTVRVEAYGYLTAEVEDVDVVAGAVATADVSLVPFAVVLPPEHQALDAGGGHTCLLTADGLVECWGYNYYGQLGDGTTTFRSIPVTVLVAPGGGPLMDVAAISAGWRHTCALTTAGTVKCWGTNGVGQLGNGGLGIDQSTPVDVLESAGGLPLTGVTAVSAGASHTCALTTAGTVKCWGYNGVGQLGDGTTTASDVPVDVLESPGGSPLGGIAAVSAGREHTCALTTTGTIRCWGGNSHGELGNGTFTFDNPSPVDVLETAGGSPLAGVAAVVAGYQFTCARMEGGTAKCWGVNYDGQLGDGTTTFSDDESIPVDVVESQGGPALTGVTDIDISVSGWTGCALLDDDSMKCWGDNYYGQLGDGTTDSRSVPAAVVTAPGGPALATVVGIAAGDLHTCALTALGDVQCWGQRTTGQLGDGTATFSSLGPLDVLESPDGPPIAGIAGVAAGSSHTCLRTIAGGVKCWGDNFYGQLGDGTITDQDTPIDVLVAPGGAALGGIDALDAGSSHTCGLTSVGGVKCWGSNYYGELGNGTTTTGGIPVDVLATPGGAVLTDVVSLGVGASHGCALMTTGGIKCWGRNTQRQLGDGTTTDRTTPVDVLDAPGGAPLGGAAAVAGGRYHTCALMIGGGVKCWGNNGSGQLGDGTYSHRSTPVDVLDAPGGAPLSGVLAVATGRDFTCAHVTGGGLLCWGDNDNGQLGDGSTFGQPSPVTVLAGPGGPPVADAVSIVASLGEVAGSYLWARGHACAQTTSGGLRCWGDNDWSQVGDGTTTNWRTTAGAALEYEGGPPLAGISAVATGARHTCALTSTGTVRCWGPVGLLGVGPVAGYSALPVAVLR